MSDDDIRADRLLAQVRAADARPGDDFLARMAALAEAAQPPAPAAQAGPLSPAARVGRLARPAGPAAASRRGLLSFLGGWPALGGMTAATVTGLCLGLAPPDGLSAWAAEVAGQVVDIGFYGEDDVLALLEG